MRESTSNPDLALITELGDALVHHLRAALGGASRAAIIDFPHHNNVGDTAIWFGEIAALKRMGVDVVAVCDDASYEPQRIRRRLGSEGVVLLHGGGSFGDIWPARHAFRLRVVQDFGDLPVVQLPQTVDFATRESALTTSQIIHRHGQVTVLVRDAVSKESLGAVDVAAVVTPDAAFAMGPLPLYKRQTGNILFLARTDHEASPSLSPLGTEDGSSTIVVRDWFDAFDQPWRRLLTGTRQRCILSLRQSAIARRTFGAPWQSLFGALASRRLRRGLGLLSTGEVVITDRLHGHILCMLTNTPHVLLDNQHGKIARFHEAFTHNSRLAHRAADLRNAFDTALELLASPGS